MAIGKFGLFCIILEKYQSDCWLKVTKNTFCICILTRIQILYHSNSEQIPKVHKLNMVNSKQQRHLLASHNKCCAISHSILQKFFQKNEYECSNTVRSKSTMATIQVATLVGVPMTRTRRSVDIGQHIGNTLMSML